MRDYSKISPRFWTGQTGKKLRESGPDAQRVAFYLVTCPSANMIGLYYLPLPTLMHEVGISEKGALEALRRIADAGFASFEGVFEHVFVPEMAAHQIGEPLDIKDNRVKGVIREWLTMRKSPFFMDFHRRYAESFHLPDPESLPRGLEAPHTLVLVPAPVLGSGQAEPKKTGFIKPTLEEVRAYCLERKNKVDPEAFIAHYESNGWRVGKNPMKCWKSAVVTFEKNGDKFSSNGKKKDDDDTPLLRDTTPKYV